MKRSLQDIIRDLGTNEAARLLDWDRSTARKVAGGTRGVSGPELYRVTLVIGPDNVDLLATLARMPRADGTPTGSREATRAR